MNINVTKADNTRISDVDFENLSFGRIFSDHMVEMTWESGSWQQPEIKPYGKISFTPALNVLHYGQAVFEGMKGYYVDDKTIHLFRPQDHHSRLNKSSARMSMPAIEYETFISALKELVKLDAKWVPKKTGQALYIRPHIFASEEYLAALVSEKYRFYIITSPVAAYYKEGADPVSLTTTDNFVRAVKGGTGEAKASGNYGASFYPAQQARKKGFTQVLWLDAIENRYVEEVGTMNIFFLINDTLVTPLLSGSVLDGITRRSVISLAKSWDVPVEERRISIDEVFESARQGSLQEIFGAGTAAVISPVGRIHHKGESIEINQNKLGAFAKKMLETIIGIQSGKLDDPFGWTHKITV